MPDDPGAVDYLADHIRRSARRVEVNVDGKDPLTILRDWEQRDTRWMLERVLARERGQELEAENRELRTKAKWRKL